MTDHTDARRIDLLELRLRTLDPYVDWFVISEATWTHQGGYKRPELIFHDPERLARILNAIDRPVQIVFAGKAHPEDEPAKHHLQHVFRHSLDPKFGGRLAFIDDYDMHLAHYLVQGCDVWLNNPRKPLEASGTSGMKAAINGTPNLSIGDGWWAEGFDGSNGWLIDGGVTGDNLDAVDQADASALYGLLEEAVAELIRERQAARDAVVQDIAAVMDAWSLDSSDANQTMIRKIAAQRLGLGHTGLLSPPEIKP